jgi:hypothetical protein
MTAQQTLTHFDGELITIHSEKSFLPSDVPGLLDAEMVRVFEDAAA